LTALLAAPLLTTLTGLLVRLLALLVVSLATAALLLIALAALLVLLIRHQSLLGFDAKRQRDVPADVPVPGCVIVDLIRCLFSERCYREVLS
jgi:hypothetical protein